jgi:hypothetical protein
VRAHLKCCKRAECSNQKDELSDGGTRDSSHSEMGGAFCGSERVGQTSQFSNDARTEKVWRFEANVLHTLAGMQ